MVLNFYLFGFIVTMIWFAIISGSIFNEEKYKRNTPENQRAIDDLHEVLNSQNPENPQLAYLLLSLVACVFWPIVTPYIVYKTFFN